MACRWQELRPRAAVFCPGFQKGRVPSEKGTLAQWTDRQKGTLARWTDRQKGTLARWTEEKGIISAVNGWKRALLTKSALEWLNKRCTAQSTLCVRNKKGKTELKAMCDWYFLFIYFFSQKGRASFRLFQKGRASLKGGRAPRPAKEV